MWGLELTRDAGPIVPAGLERGVVVNRTAETVVRLLPPLVITETESRRGARSSRCGAGRRGSCRMKQPTRGRITLRTRARPDAKKLYALIQANLEEGTCCRARWASSTVHAERFVVAVKARRIVGCAELAPLSPHVAEVRSLAVDASARGSRVGVAIVDELRRRAPREGYEKLCAFTHAPRYFIHMGFSIVPHLWLTEKVFTDCVKCPQFRQCGQYAMVGRRSTRRSTPSAATGPRCRRRPPRRSRR
jgi:amino-acid N-acetyltransferase